MLLRLSGKQHLRLKRVCGDGLALISGESAVKFAALAMAIGVTFTIVWAFSSYGYPNTDARGLPAFAAKVPRTAACL